MTKKQNVLDSELVAFCGLYCGTCFKYKKGKCPGCVQNTKASWCKIRTCNLEKGIKNCTECDEEISQCKKLNNPIGKVFEFVFRTDRPASLQFIKMNGEWLYAEKMVSLGQMSIKKGQKL